MRARGAQSPAPEHLVHQRRKTEHVRPSVPRRTADPLRRSVRPSHRNGGADLLERLCDELMHTLGWQVESEKFDGDKSIALRIVGTEDRTEYAGSNLMKNAKWTEGIVGCGASGFRLQWKTPQGRSTHRNIEAVIVQS